MSSMTKNQHRNHGKLAKQRAKVWKAEGIEEETTRAHIISSTRIEDRRAPKKTTTKPCYNKLI